LGVDILFIDGKFCVEVFISLDFEGWGFGPSPVGEFCLGFYSYPSSFFFEGELEGLGLTLPYL
jgi:hypothetical protein